MMISINIIMSVINLNLWINFEVLKSAYEHLSICIRNKLKQLNKEVLASHSHIAKILLTEIYSRDEQIRKLTQQLQKLKNSSAQNSNLNFQFDIVDRQSALICSKKYRQQEQIKIVQINQKYQQVLRQNKQYEVEFGALIQEMKAMKNYLGELKRARSIVFGQSEQFQSPAKKLAIEEQQQIFNKIQSLNRFHSIKISGTLDTIRQVTELSAASDKQQTDQQNKKIAPKIKDFGQKSPKLLNPAIQSQSFQFTNEVHDITNIFFNSSKDLSNNNQENCQSLEHSLSVLKNYCSKQNVGVVEQNKNIVLGCQLASPNIRLKNVVNQRYLAYENGYIYTGNTMQQGQTVKPMGFGQLYHNNLLVYCGYWKNGMFDGWGKMYFNNSSRIKNYTGKWTKGLAHGSGSIKYWNNDKFVGSIKMGQINGQGTLYQGNKIYQGYWQNNSLMKQQNMA